MMWGYQNMMTNWGLFGALTWLIMIVFLIMGIIYFWKEITKK